MMNIQKSDGITALVNYISLSVFSPSQGAIDEVFKIFATGILGILTKIACEYAGNRYKKRQIRKAIKSKQSIIKKQTENEKVSEQI